MNRYLEKIAKEFHTTTEVADTRVSSALGGALVGGFAAHQLNSRIGNVLQQKLVAPMLHHDPKIDADVMKRVVDKALPETNTVLDFRDTGGSPAAQKVLKDTFGGNGPFYIHHQGLNSAQKRMHSLSKIQNRLHQLDPKRIPKYDGSLGGEPTFNKNYVHMGNVRNTDILAHELGHAVDFSKGPTALKRGISNIGRRIHGVPSAALGGLALTNESTRDYAWTVPILAAVPTLREEAAANYHAVKMVRNAGGKAGLLKGLIGRNLLSYSIPALAAAGALAGVNKLRKDGEKVNPDEWLRDRD